MDGTTRQLDDGMTVEIQRLFFLMFGFRGDCEGMVGLSPHLNRMVFCRGKARADLPLLLEEEAERSSEQGSSHNESSI